MRPPTKVIIKSINKPSNEALYQFHLEVLKQMKSMEKMEDCTIADRCGIGGEQSLTIKLKK